MSSANSSPFIPSTLVWSEDDSQFMYMITNRDTQIANAVNIREVGRYELVEIQNGQQYFNPNNTQNRRNVFRKVFNVGALAAGVNNFPTGISPAATYFTRIYGVAQTTATTWVPIPLVSATLITDQISIIVTNVAGVQNIQITVGATAPVPTACVVVLEYVKN